MGDIHVHTRAIYICEDHEIVTDGIVRILLNSGRYDLIEAFKTGKDLLQALTERTPELLILDLNLPDINGLDILKEIRKNNQETRILILTMHNDPLLEKKVRQFGSNGYLLKDFGEEELLLALETVRGGRYYKSPTITESVESNSDTKALFLTRREKEIISLTALGKSSAEIASDLFLSPHTVNTHRRNIYKKLDLKNLKELIKFAHKNGLV